MAAAQSNPSPIADSRPLITIDPTPLISLWILGAIACGAVGVLLVIAATVLALFGGWRVGSLTMAVIGAMFYGLGRFMNDGGGLVALVTWVFTRLADTPLERRPGEDQAED